jgi:hypothetical protein
MKRIVFGFLILLLPAFAVAQVKTAAPGQRLVLEFVDGSDFTVTAADKSVRKLGVGIFEGDDIFVGSVIATGPDTTAELRLEPNGTIIKLAQSTSFTIASLASTAKETNAFTLLAGKVRAVAAKGAQYQVSSQTAVCAVRGTDFSFVVDEGNKAELMVAKGIVQFDKTDEEGNVLSSIPVKEGEAADAFADDFASFKYSPEQFNEQYGDLGFQKLQESEVPQQMSEASPAAPAQPEATEPAPPSPVQAATAQSAVESGFTRWLRESLGFEIGSVMIDGTTYSEAVIEPNIKLGEAKLGFYLPVIYTSNLFDSSGWYHPGGIDEWSFGSPQFNSGDYPDGWKYLAIDLALKIKYFEYGTQFQDPFFVKIGNLEDLTLGHGLIMRNYANDTDFPSVRRLGFDMGLDAGVGGFELVANDLTDPQIFGGRLFFRPIPDFKLAVGASVIVDWDPASDDPTLEANDGGLKLISGGLDLDAPIAQTPGFGIRAFADGVVTMPYTANTITFYSTTVKPGFQYQLVYDSDTGQLKNWGAASGLLGNFPFLDWRLEYRYFTGIFTNSMFDSTYDRMRDRYATEYLGSLMNPSLYSTMPTIMGIYGEGGFKLFNDKLVLNLGYFWPWSFDSNATQKEVLSSDEFHARLEIKKGLIPIVGLAAAITYDRRGLANDIADGNFKFVDADTSFGGEVDIPVPKTPNLELAILFEMEPVLDGSGNFMYASPSDQQYGIPELKPSISIVTRFHL